MRKCEWLDCGKELTKPQNQRFCSLSCATKWQHNAKAWPVGYCLEPSCGRVFSRHRDYRKVFCSRACAATFNNTRRDLSHPCIICGTQTRRGTKKCASCLDRERLATEALVEERRNGNAVFREGSTPSGGSKRNTKDIGDATEAMVLAKLVLARKKVLIPFGENHRYDLVVDEQGTFLRIQCKTARLRDGSILFSGASIQEHRTKPTPRPYTKDEIDYIAAYCADTNGVYMVPVEDINTITSLRYEPYRRGFGPPGVKWAKTYEI